MLGEVERTFGASVDIVRVDRSIVGGVAGFFGREQFEVEVAIPHVAAAPVTAAPVPVLPVAVPTAAVPTAAGEPPVAPPEPTTAPVAPTGGAAFAAALQEALDQFDEHDVDPAPSDVASTAAAAVVEDPSPEVRTAVFEQIETPAPPTAAEHVETPAPVPGTGSLLSLSAGAMSIEELAAQVDQLAIAPPASPEQGVLAVAGDGDEALVVAEALAIAGGGSAGDVLVMSPVPMPGRPSWMCLSSPDQAASRREMWRSSGRLVVVAVVVTPGVQGQEWGRAALDALEPDQTRVAVPGWRRPDEVAGRLAAIAPVHAIDLVGAVDPTAVVDFLDLAVPVATIDGSHATSRRWAEMLLAAGRSADAPEGSSAPAERAPAERTPAQPDHAQTARPGTVADDPVLTALLVAAAQEHAR